MSLTCIWERDPVREVAAEVGWRKREITGQMEVPRAVHLPVHRTVNPMFSTPNRISTDCITSRAVSVSYAATDAILANQIETSILARFIDYFINTDEFRKAMNFDLKA